jgi:hypothetical protein
MQAAARAAGAPQRVGSNEKIKPNVRLGLRPPTQNPAEEVQKQAREDPLLAQCQPTSRPLRESGAATFLLLAKHPGSRLGAGAGRYRSSRRRPRRACSLTPGNVRELKPS